MRFSATVRLQRRVRDAVTRRFLHDVPIKPRRRVQGGTIPACAGSTRLPARLPRGARDHPRVCGEHPSSGTRQSFKSGSSPRVRGARGERGVLAPSVGIIPTCAGSTNHMATTESQIRDHPRVCGEHAGAIEFANPGAGSSPRVRGSTPRRPCWGSPRRDHPRVCGEHFCWSSWHHAGKGSSPRVRGALSVVLKRQIMVGIIPACAGGTYREAPGTRGTGDHPRVCGEHVAPVSPLGPLMGSSPRVRGAPGLLIASDHQVGIIPACAGSTQCKRKYQRF